MPQLVPWLSGWPLKQEVANGRAGETAKGSSQRISLIITAAIHSMRTFNNKDLKGFFKELPGCIRSSIWKNSHETLGCFVNTGWGQMRFFLNWILQNLLSNKNLQQATLTQERLPNCIPSVMSSGKGAVSLSSLQSLSLTQWIVGLKGMCCTWFFSGHVLGLGILDCCVKPYITLCTVCLWICFVFQEIE